MKTLKTGRRGQERKTEYLAVNFPLYGKSESGKAYLAEVARVPLGNGKTPLFMWFPVSQVKANGKAITAIPDWFHGRSRTAYLGEPRTQED